MHRVLAFSVQCGSECETKQVFSVKVRAPLHHTMPLVLPEGNQTATGSFPTSSPPSRPHLRFVWSDLGKIAFFVVVFMWRKIYVPFFKVNILEAIAIVQISLKTLTPLTIAF